MTVTGDTIILGPLTVSRATTAGSTVSIAGTLDVTSSSSTTTVAGHLILGDAASDDIGIKGKSDFTKSLLIKGGLTVAENTRISGNVAIATAITEEALIVDGNFQSTASVEVNAATVIWGSTEITADIAIEDILDCRSNLTIAGTVSATANIAIANCPVKMKGLVTFQGPSLTVDTGNVEADSASFKSLTATGTSIAIGDGTDDTLAIEGGGSLTMNAPFQLPTITVGGSSTIGQNGAAGDIGIIAGLTTNAITQDGAMSVTGTVQLGDG